MVNLAIEQRLTLHQVAAMLPGNRNKPLSYTTVWRWVKQGVRGVRLEAAPMGGRWVTNLDAVQRFSERLAQLNDVAPPAPRSLDTDDVDRQLREQFGL